jgi:hypothetical protein
MLDLLTNWKLFALELWYDDEDAACGEDTP